MNPSTLIGIVASVLLLVTVVFLTAESAELFINLPGLAIVLTGTLAATFISYPLKEVVRVVRLVGVVFRRENTYVQDDINELVKMSRLWFQSDIHAVEEELQYTQNPFLRSGIQMLIANVKTDEIFAVLRWRIARLKAREHAEAQIFRTMANYSPAFGMIGTLVGLVNMMAVMEASDLSSIGPQMAVALLTTFYGILLANLLFKPVAVKLERRTEERLITMNMVLEGISLITKRRQPSFIEDTLNTFVASYRDEIRDPNVKQRPVEE
ncbi:motility protein A [Kushneria aurantia]|uniref:Motility protein A n=1 Tax=Kushneria aurantia TaxID=504092 RepID=A0ABV6FZF1_9GAMM|nr:MotA/TolQ/ExbB proton channel family protein [Kushneria aurantia]